ncbi:hypothetical protein D3C87_1933130 [compost metagenome]
MVTQYGQLAAPLRTYIAHFLDQRRNTILDPSETLSIVSIEWLLLILPAHFALAAQRQEDATQAALKPPHIKIRDTQR